jgi:hypothetical protein
MHGDYCPKKKLSLKDWIRAENLKPGDVGKCPHCNEAVRVPIDNPKQRGVPQPKSRRRPPTEPEHITE